MMLPESALINVERGFAGRSFGLGGFIVIPSNSPASYNRAMSDSQFCPVTEYVFHERENRKRPITPANQRLRDASDGGE
jgi:hypothetical protein